MRFRSLAAATLLTLQALVAARPFVAFSGTADTMPAAMHHAMAHESAPVADPPCHHAGDAADHAAPASDTPAPAPAHDHDSTACHAGTPCCAPTLPVSPTAVPSAHATIVVNAPRAPETRLARADSTRRLPPATAPPALS